MNNLSSAIKTYVQDTSNPKLAYDLAIIYEDIGQTASAITFYMRAAENTDDKELSYECLLRQGICYEKQGNRNHTASVLYRHAICLLPKRPEAYFLLSKLYTNTNQHVFGYTYAQIGLGVSFFNLLPLKTHTGYPGKYGLIFQKAVSAWHWGKNMESRKLFMELKNDYYRDLDQNYKQLIQTNLTSLGSGPDSVSFKHYNKSMIERFKFKFDGLDQIDNNHSQVYQDMFILSALKGKRNGTYLEIGSADPWFGNNTAVLEKLFGWKGIGLELKQQFVDKYLTERKNNILCQNALTADYDSLLSEIAVNGVVDYLQLDIEPSDVTYLAMTKVPFDKYKFAVITYEHDHYVDMTNEYRQKSREYLQSKGYVLVVANASPHESAPFEDWWVHPDLVDSETINKMKNIQDVTVVEKYFLEDIE